MLSIYLIIQLSHGFIADIFPRAKTKDRVEHIALDPAIEDHEALEMIQLFLLIQFVEVAEEIGSIYLACASILQLFFVIVHHLMDTVVFSCYCMHSFAILSIVA